MNSWQNALDNALEAAARGFGVFPLSRNKVPAIPSPHERNHRCSGLHECGAFGHGVGDASTDPDIIRAGFEQAPHATAYGIGCGAGPLPLLGIDLDRKNGVDGCATLNQLAREHGFTIPRTVTVCTPSGGFHLWFTGPAGAHVPNSVGKLGPGIDVRGTRGYLVTEPTVYPIPEQLLKLLMPLPAPKFRQPLQRRVPSPRGNVLDGLVQFVATAPEGTRNSRLFWAACRAWEHVRSGHLAAGEVGAALVPAAVGTGLGERDAERTVASAQKGVGA